MGRFTSRSRCVQNTRFVSHRHEARVTITQEIFPAFIGTHSRDTGKGTRYALSGTLRALAGSCRQTQNPTRAKQSAVYMNTQSLSSPLSLRPSLWLNLARLFQVVVICLTIGLFLISLPINYEHLSRACKTGSCAPGELTPANVQALNKLGVSTDLIIQATMGLDILFAVIYTASAMLIFIRKPNDLLTIFVTIMLVTFGVATFSNELEGLTALYPRWIWLTNIIQMIGNFSIVIFFFVFPTGRFIPR